MAKNLILTDPYRIKSTAESIPVNFHVPVGCQLITAFIPIKEYKELCENAERIQLMCNHNYFNANNNNNNNSSTNNNNNNSNNGNINSTNTCAFPFQFKKKLMKRDKSIVFTNIPEEGAASESRASADNATPNAIEIGNGETNNKTIQPPKPIIRPNHLPLRFKNITSKDIPESGFSSSITFDEHDSFPQFIGRTSVCSTPMTENKVLQGNILPICGNPFSDKYAEEINSNGTQPNDDNVNELLPQIGTDKKQQLIDFSNNNFNNVIANPFIAQQRQNSLIDIRESFTKLTRPLSIRPVSIGFTKFLNDTEYRTNVKIHSDNNYITMSNYLNNCDDFDSDGDNIDDIVNKKQYRTITDPTYPVFNNLGIPISRFLFEEFLRQQHEYDQLIAKNSTSNIVSKNECKTLIDTETDVLKLNKNERQIVVKPLEKLSLNINNINRNSLTLPLKSLTSESTKSNVIAAIDSNNGNIFDKPDQRRKLAGIQLTPLITKLSILAMNDERSSGFSSWDTTPGIELATPLDGSKLFRRRSSIKLDDTDATKEGNNKLNTDDSIDNEMKKVELFICGQNNMTLLLLMEECSGQKQEIVQSMV